MAVQKKKKTRSKRDKRRNTHTQLKIQTLSTDQETGEIHRRHFITKDGYYKGKEIIKKKIKKKENKEQTQ